MSVGSESSTAGSTVSVAAPHHKRLLSGSVFLNLRRRPAFCFAILALGALALGALLAPWISPFDPLKVVGPEFLWPFEDAKFPLGTDALGRDVYSGLLRGAGVSLFVGVTATLIGLAIGVSIGAIAGYVGGWVDDIFVRMIEIFQTIPSFVLLVVIVAVVPPSTWTVVIGVALVSWDSMARLTRAEFRATRELEYVMAAKSLGYSTPRIIVAEILPNALPTIVSAGSVMVANAILMESALSFMGLGDPNAISWGSMIGAGREVLRTHWYITAIPGTLIILTVFSLNILSDQLTRVVNPRDVSKTKSDLEGQI
ncbi:ABC transporter permease [Pseudomonas kitaguniensis]|uniref:ABC transporter permease n=1 Tax=Pseudomonas kitaguniensis TaxID=2607908 RepID=UPI003D00B467